MPPPTEQPTPELPVTPLTPVPTSSPTADQTAPAQPASNQSQPIDYSAFDHVPQGNTEEGVLFLAGLCVIPFAVYVAIPLMLLSVYIYAKRNKLQKQALATFLLTNGWQIDQTSYGDDVATSLVGVGNEHDIMESFGGQYRGRDMHCVHYRFVTGGGKTREEHDFLNVVFAIPETLPLVVLDNKHNRTFGLVRDLPERIPGGKPLQLEGNFNDTFQVTVMPGTEQEVLQLLTPDFMQQLQSTPPAVDFELEANKYYVITKNDDFNGTTLRELFAGADCILDQLSKISGTWQASSSADNVAAIADDALAARKRLLLRPSHVGIGLILVLVFYLLSFGFSLLRR